MGTSILSRQIRDQTIESDNIADQAVTEDKLAINAIATAKIQDLAVTNAKLAGSISTDKLEEGSLFYKDGDTITLQSGSVISTEEQILVETTVENVTSDDPEPSLSTDGVAIDGYVRWAVSNSTFTAAEYQGWGYLDGFGWVKLDGVYGFVLNGSSISGLADARGASRFYMQVLDSPAPETSEGHMLSGAVFQWTSASQVSLVPSGIDGNARIPVSSGSDLIQIVVGSTLVADITVAGAGGLDTGSEASSTGYDLRLVTKALGADPVLLFTVSGNAPTLPGSYTYQSDVLWFARNDGSSNFEPFYDAGQGWCTYTFLDPSTSFKGITVLSNGTSTAISPAASIDFANVVPEDAVEVRVLYWADYTGAGGTGNGAFFYKPATGASNNENLLDIQDIADNPDEEFLTVTMTSGTDDSLRYSVSSSDVNMDVKVVAWKLRRN